MRVRQTNKSSYLTSKVGNTQTSVHKRLKTLSTSNDDLFTPANHSTAILKNQQLSPRSPKSSRTPNRVSPKRQFETYFHKEQYQDQRIDISSIIRSSEQPNELWKRCKELKEKLQINLEVNDFLRRENERLEGKISYYSKETDKFRKEILDNEERFKGLQQGFTLLKKECAQKTSEIKALEKKLQEFKILSSSRSSNQDNNENESQEREIGQLKSQLSTLQNEIKSLKVVQATSVDKHSEQVADLKIEFQNKLEAERSKVKEHLESLSRTSTQSANKSSVAEHMFSQIKYLITQYADQKSDDGSSSDDSSIPDDSEQSQSEQAENKPTPMSKFTRLLTIEEEGVGEDPVKATDLLTRKLSQLESAIVQSIDSQKQNQTIKWKFAVQEKQAELYQTQGMLKALQEENQLLKLEIQTLTAEIASIRTKYALIIENPELDSLQSQLTQQIAGTQQNLRTISPSTLDEEYNLMEALKDKCDIVWDKHNTTGWVELEQCFQGLTKELLLMDIMLPDLNKTEDPITKLMLEIQSENNQLKQKLVQTSSVILEYWTHFQRQVQIGVFQDIEFCRCKDKIMQIING